MEPEETRLHFVTRHETQPGPGAIQVWFGPHFIPLCQKE